MLKCGHGHSQSNDATADLGFMTNETNCGGHKDRNQISDGLNC